MRLNNQPPKFKDGSVVYALNNMSQKLMIRTFKDRIYYCTTPDHPGASELAFFEREIMMATDHQS